MKSDRPHVVKLDEPVIRGGKRVWWAYYVPTRFGVIYGWQETQGEAFAECLNTVERAQKGGYGRCV